MTSGAAGPLRDEILRKANDIEWRVFSGGCSEIYLENAYRDDAGQPLPNTKLLGDRALMVEVHPPLQAEPLKRRAEALRDIIEAVLSSQGRANC